MDSRKHRTNVIRLWNKPIELEGLETQGEAQKALDFPYSFAKRNGVVLQRDINGELIVHYKKGITPTIANEVNTNTIPFKEKSDVQENGLY